MKAEFVDVLKNGMVIVDNTFETPKGKYNILIKRYKNWLYIFKYRDGILLECRNLSTASPKPVMSNQ